MNKAARSARLVSVTDDADGPIDPDKLARGLAIQKKRLALGLSSEREFMAASGVDRTTIGRAEEGKASPGTYDRLEAFLDKLDERMSSEREEMGEAVAEGAPSTFSLTVRIGALDWSATGSGAKEDAELIRQQLAELMKEAMREAKE